MTKGIEMSAFKLLCYSCGLTKGDAVEFLKVNENNALSWWLGRRPCPPGVLEQLRKLFDLIDRAAVKLAQRIEAEAEKADIELEVVATDKEAEALGLPTVGAHEAMFRRVLEILPPAVALRVKVVKPGDFKIP